MKIIKLLLLLIIVAIFFVLCSCEFIVKSTDDKNSEVGTVIMNDDSEIGIMSFKQEATKNNDFLNTEVSWHDDEYNYYVYEIGTIKNVPLTSTCAKFVYNGGKSSFENEVTKTTQESVKAQTTQAVKKFTSISEGNTLNSNIQAGIPKELSASIESGYSRATTNTEEKLWQQSYESCVIASNSEKNTVKLEFDSSCQKGNYLYLQLGDVRVYFVVVKERGGDKIYTETFNEVKSYTYGLAYVGQESEIPENKAKKIEIDPSFISNLEEPEEYIPGQKPEVVFEPVTQSWYWDESFSLWIWDAKAIIKGKVWDDFSKYYALGYDKIKIDYNIYASTTTNIFGNGATVYGQISNTDQSMNGGVHSFEKEPSENGSWINGSTTTDLAYFANTNKICLFFESNNSTERFTVSKITLKVTLYKNSESN
ncbi:MAG: hypothetical protein II984_05540 [Clostridia bacterium]|nr:hypothetical protein [Clostridia bacterium]